MLWIQIATQPEALGGRPFGISDAARTEEVFRSELLKLEPAIAAE